MNDPTLNYKYYYQKWGNEYPNCGFGGMFTEWVLSDDAKPYNSFGNGSAMRVSPVAYAYDTLEQVLKEARRSAEVSHNHPEGIKGAQAVATAIFLARKGATKSDIRLNIQNVFGYDLNRHSDIIRETYGFDVTCQGSVPESIISFLDSKDYEDAIRIAVSLGGDSDTIACIAGSIAEAFYKVIPEWMSATARAKLTKDLYTVLNQFEAKYV